MKYLALSVLPALLFVFGYAQFSDETLYPVLDNGRYAFVDSKGKVVIKPMFYAADFFSEGLAAVRQEAHYGYINEQGDYLIPPRYAYAEAFRNGIAIVYTAEAKPKYIDKKGEVFFEHDYEKLFPFDENDLAKVQTASGKYGLVNKTGKLIVDTVMKEIGAYNTGLYGVSGMNHRERYKENPNYEVGFVDKTGAFVVPFGRYADMEGFRRGYSIVNYPDLVADESNVKKAVIDPKGEVLFEVPYQEWDCFMGLCFYDGLAKVDVYKDYDQNSYYTGFVNLKAEVVLSDEAWKDASTVYKECLFVKDTLYHWRLINLKGEPLCEQTFRDIAFVDHNKMEAFEDGLAVVRNEEGQWGTIDVKGRFMPLEIKNSNKEYRYFDCNRESDIAVLVGYDSETGEYKYAIWNLKNNKTSSLKYQYVHSLPFGDLVLASVNERHVYVDKRTLKEVWKASKQQQNVNWNIDYIKSANFIAKSPIDSTQLWKRARETKYFRPQKISEQSDFLQNDSLALIIRPEEENVDQSLSYFKAYIVNNTDSTLEFSVQDNRLYMKVQAQDEEGEWKDVEYLPSSWCGNSYSKNYLPAQHFWSLDVPKYEGSFKTKLRLALSNRSFRAKNKQLWYSDSYEASINKAQFWRIKPYVSAGIMDPYAYK